MANMPVSQMTYCAVLVQILLPSWREALAQRSLRTRRQAKSRSLVPVASDAHLFDKARGSARRGGENSRTQSLVALVRLLHAS